MTERAEHLKNLIRHSSKAELELTQLWFNDAKCSKRMQEQKKEIHDAIEYLKKDGRTDITIKETEEDVIIRLEAK